MMKLERLGNICDLQNGYAFKSSDYTERSNTLCCRMSNIRPDSKFDIDYNPKYLPDHFTEKYKEFVLKDGDIIIAMTDMATDPKILGVPTQVETKGHTLLLNQRVGKLFNFNLEKVCLPYIKVALGRKELKEYYKRFSGGGIQLNISKENILNIKIPLPTLSDQIRIAEILNKVESLIAQRKQSISLLDELLKSTFLEMFGDPVRNEKGLKKVKLVDITTKITDGKHGDCNDEENSGYYFLSAKDLVNGELKYHNVREITKADFIEVHKRTDLKLNDILLGNTGASIGKIGIVKDEEKASKTVFQKSISIISVKNEMILPHYLKAYLDYNRSIFNATSTGSAMPNLLLSQIRAFDIIVPSIKLQNEFIRIVEKVEALKSQSQQSLTESQNMYGVLSQKAFKGELSLDKNKKKEKV